MTRRILIVDDEESIRISLARHFRMHDMEVETASDGLDALEKLSRTPYRVIISDVMMPRMDGIGLLRRMRSEYPMTRSIMITGYVTLENALACLKFGAETCVFKPFSDLSELDQAVDAAFAYHERWEQKLLQLRGMREMGA
ncbi:MAG: response regulator [Fibrobacterota bacterium]|nr:response regulator [Fibrobacterota bacterium]QQS05515.1 MAG: response regulator [Fibrobacterota bacterium]